jgi:hypothetical protein
MERLRTAPSDLPGGRPVASAAVSGLTPSPAALRASHPAPAERTAAWPPPAPALRRPIALTPFWPATFTRARVLASSQAAAAAPATGPPGPKQGPPASRPPGPPRPMLAAARGPLTRPPCRPSPSPPAPVVDRFGCASPRALPHRRPPAGTVMIPPRASSRSCPAYPDTSPRPRLAHA